MIDSHCHLYFDSFNGNRDQLIADAIKAGVEKIINIGIDLESSRQCIELAEQHENLYATVGVHPHDAKTFSRSVLREFKIMAQHPRVVAIGEIGLDFYRDNSPRPVQREVFRQQLELAVETKLPVVIHSRESFDECLTIIQEFATDLVGGVFHCFPGDVDDAERAIELGFVLGIGGVATFKNSAMSRVATHAPLESIILETDAPFLAPVPFRGQTNQPAYVRQVCERIAELKKVSFSEVEKVTSLTCSKLFGLAETFEG